MDLIIPWCRKQSFNPQQCFGWCDLLKIFNAAGQLADTTA